MTTERERGAAPWRVLVAVLCAFVLVAGACAQDETSEEQDPAVQEDQGRDIVDEGEPQYGGALAIGINGETNGWNPQYSQFGDAGWFVAGTMFEPLAILNSDGEFEPYLLESYTPNEDATEWTLVTKEGITFHNGEPFDADAVIANLQATIDSPLSGVAQKDNFDSWEKIDDRTVLVRATFPWYSFPNFLAGQSSLQAAPAMHNAEDKGVTEPIGTGPYQFDEWRQDDYLRVVAYDDYWQEGPPYLQEMEFKVIVDPDARATALETGEIDMMETLSPSGILQFRDQEGFYTVEDNHSEETFVMLNEAVPPFDNENARLALAYGTDQAQIAETLGEGITRPVTSPYQEGSPWYVEDDGYPEYDAERAAEYVQAYEDETGEPLSFEFKGLNNLEDIDLQQVLIEMWSSIGIDAQIDTVEQSAFIIELAAGQYQAAWFRNFGYNDPDSNTYFWHSRFANGVSEGDGLNISVNFTQTQIPELDAAVEQIQQGATFEERKAASDEAVRILNEEAVYIWLYNTPYAIVASDVVAGLNPAREVGFGNFEPKWWMGWLWRTDQ